MISLEGKRVIVTGGAGFIGSHLVDLLIKENPKSITIVDNLFLGKLENIDSAYENRENVKLNFEQLDASKVMDMAWLMSRHKIDVVFNLAVLPLPHSLEDPVDNITKNIAIVTNLCEMQREGAFDTLVHFSSSEAYGTAIHETMDENHPLIPTTPYAASKAACDHIVLSYVTTYGTDSTIIRPFNNFGERQNDKSYAGVIPLTINRILDGEHPLIYGDGKQTRDYLYVKETARMAIEFYKNPLTKGRIINIGSGVERTIESVIMTIVELMQNNHLEVKEPLYVEDRIGDVKRHIANIFLAKDLLNFEPDVNFKKQMKDTINWYVNKRLDNRVKLL